MNTDKDETARALVPGITRIDIDTQKQIWDSNDPATIIKFWREHGASDTNQGELFWHIATNVGREWKLPLFVYTLKPILSVLKVGDKPSIIEYLFRNSGIQFASFLFCLLEARQDPNEHENTWGETYPLTLATRQPDELLQLTCTCALLARGARAARILYNRQYPSVDYVIDRAKMYPNNNVVILAEWTPILASDDAAAKQRLCERIWLEKPLPNRIHGLMQACPSLPLQIDGRLIATHHQREWLLPFFVSLGGRINTPYLHALFEGGFITSPGLLDCLLRCGQLPDDDDFGLNPEDPRAKILLAHRLIQQHPLGDGAVRESSAGYQVVWTQKRNVATLGPIRPFY